MCGIVGFCDFLKKSSSDILKNMTDILHHRGPDDSGYFWDENEYSQIALGHRRLSILDLSAHGHQPMSFEHLDIVFNGEVYNFKEIKKELLELGYSFHSDSDTEVILKSYHQWGTKAVDKFNGMFAITIYDKKANKLIFIRDRAGVKPFYYYKKDSLILFSSELKSFHNHPDFQKDINKSSLSLYLQFGYIPEPHSIFKNTYKLKAGHYIEIDLKSQKFEEIKYWDVVDFYNKPKLDISQNEAIEKTEELLKSSFEYRMVSDVPVGVFLSGGYDSSVVTAILQKQRTEKLNTFTIGFKEKGFDEAPYAKEVAKYLGTNHTEYYCTQKDALEIIPKLCEIYDEPFGDSSAIPTILVSQLARKDVTVSLSADGGDEIFAGYSKYTTALQYFNKFKSIPNSVKSLVKLGMDNINPNHIPILSNTYNFATRYEKINGILKAKSSVEAMKYTSEYFTKKERDTILNVHFDDLKTNFDIQIADTNDEMNQMLAIDYKTYMIDDILTKVDRATMSVSLEGREPLLDYRIVEFVSQLPSNLKYKDGDKKWLLKQITHKYLPKEMMDRPKQGFGVPLTEWFRDELKEYFMIYLDERRIEKEGLFNSKEVVRLRDSYLSGNRENVQKLWFLLMFEMWYEKWM
ncbi:asparagine synthase (glutamine-hydrolyzing) [Aliarcobacter skirrowii]|uniref:asparagine synthase (glutamine-hydrolyzing) n=1 Tax=Aliarcobacter skirrowii TaxID=28200 RepID=UPI0021B2E67F|nr:asparagine synthase (glutamine-hydrolyzing) [Aliarcobacter skirrowii]MCT7446757.1 asparagine synthase (glutamine-hydrolyzing) [Aliarcobacter skirrowii]